MIAINNKHERTTNMNDLKKRFSLKKDTVEEMEEVCTCNTCTCTCTCTGLVPDMVGVGTTPLSNVAYIGSLYIYG